MSKPLSFDKVPPPAPVKASGGPKPLSFSAAPVPQQKVVKPQAAQPVVKTLSFDNVPTPPRQAPTPVHSSTPRVTVESKSDPLVDVAIAALKGNPNVDRMRVAHQINQLLPIKIETVLDWGSKTLDRMRDSQNRALQLIKTFVDAQGSEAIEQVLEMISGSKPTGFFARLVGGKGSPSDLKPQLAVLLANIPAWMHQCETHQINCEENDADLLVKLTTLATVADSLGVIPDNQLDSAIANRRSILQQACLMSQMTLQQLKDTRTQMIDQRMRIDQILNITLPNYERANLHR